MVSLPPPTRSSCLVSAAAFPEGRRVLPGPGICCAGRPSFRLLARGREWDLSGLQAIHPVPLLRSTTPVETTCLAITVASLLPPLCAQRRLRAMLDFGANPQLRHLLSYASRVALPHTCKARFRLAGWPLPGGSQTHWTAAKGFSSYSRPSPSPALLTLAQ